MKLKNIYIIISLGLTAAFITFASCKKGGDKIIINGNLYDPNLKTYVSNARVTISSSGVSSGIYNSNYTEIATVTTDEKGAFAFEFDKIKSAGYRFYFYREKYFDKTIDVPANDIIAGKPYSALYCLYPESFIKLRVKNATPFDSSDFIAYSYSTDNSGCAGCCTNTTFTGSGKVYDVTTKCKTYGGQKAVINWHVKKFNYDLIYSDSFFCAAFDTAFYEILY